jgi:lipopolysaccharide transport system ATP-binding protein
MSDLAIQVSGLSKRYRIGRREEYQTFREALIRGVSTPLRLFQSWTADKQNGLRPGWIWALRDVNLAVKQGEVIGIIGRNGAGKSTLLKVLSGITEPTTGYADIYGRVGSLLEVGTGFHMELTGRENIYMNGALLGMRRPEIKRRFDEIVAFSEVEEFLDTPVKRYSSGMYMRLAFAVAAHLEPEILLVDEVLAVGDASFQKKCLGKMGDVARQGRTVLFVSHNMSTIQALCQKAVWLEAGQVKDIGPTAEVVHRYLESAMSTAVVPIAERTDRKGDGSVQVYSIQIESADRQPVIRTRSRLRITINYVSDKPLRHPRFILDVHDLRGTGIYQLDTKCTGELPEVLPARGAVVCETGPINLSPGRCYVNLEVLRGGEFADYVTYAAQFDVEAEDFYPTGRMPKRDWFIGVIQQDWYPLAEAGSLPTNSSVGG